MNNILYKRADVLAKYPVTATPVNYVVDTWVDLFVSDAVIYNSDLVSFEIERTKGATDSPTTPEHRLLILREGHTTQEVIYPTSTGAEKTEALSQYLLYPTLKINVGDVLTVQIKCTDDATGTATATLLYVEFLEKR